MQCVWKCRSAVLSLNWFVKEWAADTCFITVMSYELHFDWNYPQIDGLLKSLFRLITNKQQFHISGSFRGKINLWIMKNGRIRIQDAFSCHDVIMKLRWFSWMSQLTRLYYMVGRSGQKAPKVPRMKSFTLENIRVSKVPWKNLYAYNNAPIRTQYSIRVTFHTCNFSYV